jgi:hypothetical protein
VTAWGYAVAVVVAVIVGTLIVDAVIAPTWRDAHTRLRRVVECTRPTERLCD